MLNDGAIETWWNAEIFPERGRALGKEVTVFSMAAPARLSEAENYYKLGKYEAAFDAARKCVGDPADHASYLSLLLRAKLPEKGRLQSVPGERLRAEAKLGVREVEEAVELLLWSAVALIEDGTSSEDTKRCALAVSKRIRETPSASGRLVGDAAQIFMLCGGGLEAGAMLQEALKRESGALKLWYLLFQSFWRSGKKEEAHGAAIRAEECASPNSPRYYECLAEMFGVTGDWQRSLKYAELQLKTAPRDSECLWMAAVGRINQGDKVGAKAYLQQLALVSPKHPRVPWLSKLVE